MKIFTHEQLNPSEKTLEFIRKFAYSYTPSVCNSSSSVSLCLG